MTPKFSVIIPAYNQAEFLAEAIQSVIAQTYTDFEVIVVNDSSPDNTSEIVRQFDDPRIKLIEHAKNLGLGATRNTAIEASTGEIIAFLDADDIFHPEKLEKHAKYLSAHPDISATYNSHFRLNHSKRSIRELLRPLPVASLSDFVLGFPFPHSDLVIRREWQEKVLFDTWYVRGGDQDMLCRLAMEGCQFRLVDRALNFRRHHSGRYEKDPVMVMERTRSLLQKIFDDPRCPEDVRNLKNEAIANTLVVRILHAFAQDYTAAGQDFTSEAVRLQPSLLKGYPVPLMSRFLWFCIEDDSVDHVAMLGRFVQQLPSKIPVDRHQVDFLAARGFLIKGYRAILWDRPDDGEEYFRCAVELNAEFDEPYISHVAHQLITIEHEFGREFAEQKRALLRPYIERVSGKRWADRLDSLVLINRAHRKFTNGLNDHLSGDILSAIAHDPRLVTNRGVLSMLVRSSLPSFQPHREN